MVNKQGTTGEQLFQTTFGLETDAKHFVMANGDTLEDIKKREATIKVNEAIAEKEQEINKKIEHALKTSQDIIDNKNELEIMPVYKYILIKPYAENPYQKISVTKSGIITDLSGQAPVYKSNETGEFEEEKQIMKVGQVLEVGPEVSYVKEGDDVFYKEFNEVPIPFFKQGLVVVNELSVMTVINSRLKERFNSLK